MRKAIFAGSFNPFTIAHADIVARGLHIFDHVVIAIGRNIAKPADDTANRKIEIETLYAGEPRVSVMTYDGLTVDLAHAQEAEFLLRGVRNTVDFEYERQIAETNRSLSGIETIILLAKPEHSHISSSLVRELKSYGKDVSDYLPQRNQ